MTISKIGSKALVDCSVAAVDIADGSITTAKLAGSITNAKLANSSVTINSTSVSLGASINLNALDWQTVQTTGFTASAGKGYFCNTTSAAFTVTLPASATLGDTIALKDYAGTFGTNNLTINRNGHNIQGAASNALISTNRASVVLVYVDITRGWEFTTESNVAALTPQYISATGGTVATSGNFKIHTFTGDGCFVVSTVGNPAGGGSNVDYLVVAGGGGGGNNHGGGGGAGGFRTSFPSPGCNAGSFPVTATTFPITVGGGGAGGSPGTASVSGSPSIFSTITSTGGGKGGGPPGGPGTASPGGSGGGGSGEQGSGTAGTGNSPPTNPPQGNSGGLGQAPQPNGSAGGGGGAGGAGTARCGSQGGPGGVGSPNVIYDSPTVGTPGPAPGRYYAGGGGGSSSPTGAPVSGTGGAGGGGNSGPVNPGASVQSGTANTGGGGGGGPGYFGGTAGSGGKGIVIIRYKFQ